jgi:CheY-like chemotaxis protein/two-component sensor histidine kinase
MDRRKDDFLAMLGHELRNPLGAINNALHVIDSRAERDEWLLRYHRVIDRQINHLSRIVDDLLDASRVRLGKIVLERRAVDLRSVAERWREAFGTTAAAQARHLSFDLADKPVMVFGDPVRVEQILANLLANALKYTPAGGRIFVTVQEEGGKGVMRVRDTGIGISPDVLPRIFDLFTQADESLARSQGGLGLGLSLVRGLVQMHGGEVDAQSTLGEGTEFVVWLPLSNLAVEPATTKSPPPVRRATRPLRVLVVEDNEDARETLKAMLEQWKHEVEACGEGIDGLGRALTHPPDVALIDIGLPGIDGYELARRIRQQLTAARPFLIAMTGYGQPENRRRALDVGFDAYMVKPFDPDELQARLLSLPVPPG